MRTYGRVFREGEAVVVDPAAGATPPTGGANGAVDYWSAKPVDILPADFKVPYQGKEVSAKEVPFFSETKTLKDLVSRGYENFRTLGSAIKLPTRDSKPEEISAFIDKMLGAVPKDQLAPTMKAKLRSNGVLPNFPEKAEAYEIKAPAEWRDVDANLTSKVKDIAYKYEVPQAMVSEIMDLYFDTHKDIVPAFKELQTILPTLKETKENLKTQFDDRIRKAGKDPEAVAAEIGRYAAKRFSQEDIALLGDAGNHPMILQMMYDLAKAEGAYMGQPGMPGEQETEDAEATKELDKYLTPGTPENLAWSTPGEAGVKARARVVELRKAQTGGR